MLEFDHLGEKAENVATLVELGVATERLEAEIARCAVVCVNCHRRRTADRAGWLRASPTWREDLGRLEPRIARNLRFLYEHLQRSGCVDCKCADLAVLDFDHEGPKRFNVTRGAWNGFGLARLSEEIEACAVRCANCHRRKTAERGRHRRWIMAQSDAGH